MGTGDMGTSQRTLFQSNRNRIQREILTRDLVAIFNLLADAVALEQHCELAYSRRPAQETLQQWNLCRRTVGSLGRDYAHSVARYRKVVNEGFRPKPRRAR